MYEKNVTFRFYGELNDFLPFALKKRRFPFVARGKVSVKDLIESAGAPHVEIDLIVVNNRAVDFTYIVQEGDHISVYPEFRSIDIGTDKKLKPERPRGSGFLLDVHLGRLAAYLRMAGFDTLYEKDYPDETIARISAEENRTVLTRDVGLLKRNEVSLGYFVRSDDPEKQLKEVIRRHGLANSVKLFSRCMVCNSPLEPVAKEEVEEILPPKVKEHNDFFTKCAGCGKVYWEGTHFESMLKLIDETIK